MAKQSKLFRKLEEYVDCQQCEKCSFYSYTTDYLGEGDERCLVVNNTDMDLRWYCFMPRFIKRIVKKHYERLDMKLWQEYWKEEGYENFGEDREKR